MTPLEVMDGRITKLKKEITTEKNATTKSQKEALLQQMEGVKGEIEGKTKGNVEGNNNIEYNSIYDADKYQYIYNGELMWPDMKDKDILMSIKDQKDKLFTEYRKKEDALWKQYSNNIEQYTNLRNPIHEQYLKELSELN